MLVLSRKRGEGIVIGEGITVTVLEIRGDRVKLGFACPVEVPIHRSEVRRSIGKDSLRKIAGMPVTARLSPWKSTLSGRECRECPGRVAFGQRNRSG